MNYSFWEGDSFTDDIDVAIIGGGIVGLSAAIHLKAESPGLRVVVLEQGVILSGASLRNAGFACFAPPSELLADLAKSNATDVFKLVEKRWKGLLQLRQLLGDSAIGYELTGGHEVYETDGEFERYMEHLPLLNQYLAEIIGKKEIFKVHDGKIEQLGLNGFKHLVEIQGEAQLNTGKMMQAFVQKATVHEVTMLNGVQLTGYTDNPNEVILKTNWKTLQAKRVLFATNGYTSSLLKDLDVKPARAQVVITSPIEGLKIHGNFHFDEGYYYFRNVGNRILFGGGRNLDFEKETTTELDVTKKIQTALEKILAEKILPSTPYTIENRWSGVMGVGSDKWPIVKKYSTNVFCAVRMGGMGIALGTGTGQEAAELVLNSFKS